jgi:SAM-dependent methyltransferase
MKRRNVVSSRGEAQPDDWDRHWRDLERVTSVNPAQKYRRQLVVAALKLDEAASPKLLDIGSGLGDLMVDVHAIYPEAAMLGLELSKNGVKIATRRLPQVKFLQCDLIAGNNNPGPYEAFATHAACSEVLEHVDDPVLLLRNARSYLSPGCRLVVTVPGGPKSQFDLHFGHRHHFTPEDLRQVPTAAGSTVEYTVGAGFPFFNLYHLMVILCGASLISDSQKEPSLLLRAVSAIFEQLFKLNLLCSQLGWQTYGVARL